MNPFQKKISIALSCILCFALGSFITGQKEILETEDILHAQKLIGFEFTQTESYVNMGKMNLPNNIPPAYEFNPVPVGNKFDTIHKQFKTWITMVILILLWEKDHSKPDLLL